MAGLTWADVAIIGAVATIGFTLVCFWYSGVMAKRNWSYQVKPKKKDDAAKPSGGASSGASNSAKP